MNKKTNKNHGWELRGGDSICIIPSNIEKQEQREVEKTF